MFGALDDKGRVTPDVGRQMAVYPLEPSLSRMMVEADRPQNDCVEEMATICAMLSAENLFHFPRRMQRFREDGERGGGQNPGGGRGRRPLGSAEEELERHAVEDAHDRLKRSNGDHFTYLYIYEQWVKAGNFKPCIFAMPY